MSTPPWEMVKDVAGLRIVGLRRIFYEFRGELDRTVGALELSLSDGLVLSLDAGSDGESLTLREYAWEDPFSGERLTIENREYIARHGKWTAVDVSGDPEYASVLGAVILRARPILGDGGKVVGLEFDTDRGALRAEVEADDLYVQVG